MYQAALAQAGVTASESVFVGHDEHELFGARSAGMKTIAFNHKPDVQADWFIEHFADLLALPCLQEESLNV
jgi:FMN phosphatase YigB (HAD superfamily)